MTPARRSDLERFAQALGDIKARDGADKAGMWLFFWRDETTLEKPLNLLAAGRIADFERAAQEYLEKE